MGLPPSNPSTSGGLEAKDAGKDSGKTDAGKDSGPPPPEPGDACSKADQIFKKECGKCGSQEAVCLGDDAGTASKVSDYGPCTGEVADGCTPGTTEDLPCGNCGTSKKTCSKYCAWSTSTCAGEPANSCKPGTIDYSTAGCATPATYRNRTCGAACTWGNYSAVCAEPNNPLKLVAKGVVNQVASGQFSLTANPGKRPNTCGGTASTASDLKRVGVEVKNPTAKTMTASVYHTKAPGGQELDTLIWAYKNTLPPTDDATLVACDFGVGDSCSITGNPCGGATSYNLAGIENVVIPPNGKILVYSSGYSSTVSGAVMLNVRTDELK